MSLVDTKDETLRRKLVAAAMTRPSRRASTRWSGWSWWSALPVLVLLYFWLTGSSPSMIKLYFSLVVAAAMGLYVPAIFVRAQGRPAPARNHQRVSRRARPDAGLRRSRPRAGGGIFARRHGDDDLASAARRAVRLGRPGASRRAQPRRRAAANGRPRRGRRNPRLRDAADPVDQARLVDRADAAHLRVRNARASAACGPRKRRTGCRC